MESAEQVEPIQPKEADVSTVNHAASKILSLMDGTPSVDTTHPDTAEPEVTPEEPEVQAEQESEIEPEVVKGREPEEPTEEEVATRFTDIAEHLGVEESFLESLTVPTKVNGEEREATIKDLVANFQKGESADIKLMELADERKHFNTDLENAKDQLTQEWSRAQALNDELQRMLTGDDNAEIESLRHSDPGEYAARMAEKQSRLQKAQKIQNDLQSENANKLITQYQQRVGTERAKLVESIPSWADDKVRETEALKMRKYLKAEGFKDFEIDGQINNGQLQHAGMIDHRLIVMANKARMFDEARKGAEPKKKRMKTLPKVGSGQPKGKGEVLDAKKSSVRAKAKESGSVNDAAEVIRQLMES
jgi:hypothetical protein